MKDYIIGIDTTKSPCKDMGVVSLFCCDCRTIIHWEAFEGEEPEIVRPEKCPNCGVIFKNGEIRR